MQSPTDNRTETDREVLEDYAKYYGVVDITIPTTTMIFRIIEAAIELDRDLRIEIDRMIKLDEDNHEQY